MKLFERVLIAVDAGSGGIDLIRYTRAIAGVLGDVESASSMCWAGRLSRSFDRSPPPMPRPCSG